MSGELIDKQKLLKWAKTKESRERSEYELDRARAIALIVDEIESGTFDDHSAQEGMDRQKQIIEQQQRDIRLLTEASHRWEAKALQAEQEREEWHKATKEAQSLLEPMQADRMRLMEERNALLEGLKGIRSMFYGRDRHAEMWDVANEMVDAVDSIIAKIQGDRS